MDYELPEVGSFYQHKNGGIYQVTAITNLNAAFSKDEFPITIIYYRLSDQTLWTRPLARWEGKFKKVTLTYNILE